MLTKCSLKSCLNCWTHTSNFMLVRQKKGVECHAAMQKSWKKISAVRIHSTWSRNLVQIFDEDYLHYTYSLRMVSTTIKKNYSNFGSMLNTRNTKYIRPKIVKQNPRVAVQEMLAILRPKSKSKCHFAQNNRGVDPSCLTFWSKLLQEPPSGVGWSQFFFVEFQVCVWALLAYEL